MWLYNNLKDRYKVAICVIGGILLSLSLIIGYEIYNYNDISRLFFSFGTVIGTIFRFLILSFLTSFLFMLVFSFVSRDVKNREYINPKYTKRTYILVFLISWIVLFGAFLIAFLAFYPGNLSYDFNTQSYYYNGILPFTRHHPVLHSFFLFGAIKYGTDHGLYAETPYAFAQIVLLSFIIACSTIYLMKLRIKLKGIIAFLLFYICNPVVAIMAVSTTKDALFGGLFLFVMVILIYICKYSAEAFKDMKVWIVFILSVTLCALMRNNAIYAFILTIPVCVICIKKYRKKALLLWIIPIICFFLVDSVLFGTVMSIPKGSSAEKLCVPMQQMAYTYCENSNNMSNDDIQFIDRYIPVKSIEDTYNPRFADPIKDIFDAKMYDSNKISFWKNWLKLGLKYPNCYLRSFLNMNITYWYIGADTIDPYADRDYIEVFDTHRLAGESKAPRLLSLYRKVTSYELVEKVPPLGVLFSITTPLWFLIICLLYCLFNKQYVGSIPLMPGLFLMLTLIAGPVCNFRYIFPIVMIYPCLIILMVMQRDRS